MHHSLIRPYSGFRDFEDALSALDKNLDRGDGFEALAKFYLEFHSQTYLLDKSHFPRVDSAPFPEAWITELGLGRRDLGIDGIYRRSDDDLVAVQVKYRSNEDRLSYSDLATFWSEAEGARYRMVFTNALEVTDVATRRRGHLLISREQLDSQDDEFWSSFYIYCLGESPPPRPKKAPRDYQSKAINDIAQGFSLHDRGKLIAACGIGKTLIGLWTMDRLNSRNILFMAPNLQLIRQTLNEWASQSREPFNYLSVCSDHTIDSAVDEISDAVTGTDIATTTDPDEIVKFLRVRTKKRKIIFSTYQSLDAIAHATQLIKYEGFDLAIFDEAHKTTGMDSDSSFGLALVDDKIRIEKRLFLTATERLISPRLQAVAADHDRVVFSMDDKSLYGETFHRLSFSEAISKGIISDYRIVVAVMAGSELKTILDNYNFIIDTDDEDQRAVNTNSVINQAVLKKVLQETGAQKLVSYHRSVKEARSFAEAINSGEDFESIGAKGFSVDGSMSSSKRSQVIKSFEQTETGVLTNARCLVEGVDIPVIDGVFFASPKNSLIDIVQAVGRALRKPFGPENVKIAVIVVPIVLDSGSEVIDASSTGFDRLYNLIQALRDQDQGVADVIDQLNLDVSTGRTRQGRGLDRILRLIVPAGVSITKIREALELRIAEVNGNNSGSVIPVSHLGAGQRGSSRDRKLRTIGDYTPAKYRESLVDPTIARFVDSEVSLPRNAIKISNNNVGHCEKIGVIINDGSNKFHLTDLGRKYQNGQTTFDDLFKNQLLLYRDSSSQDSELFPYRLFIEFMLKVQTISYWEFLYGIYTPDISAGTEDAVVEAVNRVTALRNLNINPAIANERSKDELLRKLEEATGLKMDVNDVWTDRTTTFNQFRYFRRHLELFNQVFFSDGNVFKFRDNGELEARNLLNRSSFSPSDLTYGSSWWLDR